jgi:hypothetical protein
MGASLVQVGMEQVWLDRRYGATILVSPVRTASMSRLGFRASKLIPASFQALQNTSQSSNGSSPVISTTLDSSLLFTQPLPDLSRYFLPDWSSLKAWIPLSVGLCVLLTLVRILLVRRQSWFHSYQISLRSIHPRWLILRRVLVILAGLLIVRMVSLPLTLLPDPLQICPTPPITHTPLEFMQRAVQYSVFYSGIRPCTGYLLTIDAMLVILCLLCWNTYVHHQPSMDRASYPYQILSASLPWLFYLLSMATLLFMMVTRTHYMVEIMIDFPVVYSLFMGYHWAVRCVEMHSRDRMVPGPSLEPIRCLGWLITWFEGVHVNSDHKLQA